MVSVILVLVTTAIGFLLIGMPIAYALSASGIFALLAKGGTAPDEALRLLGICPKEIDTVIMSHLHWDHCYNNHLFPQADFYIQKKEMMSAVCPLPK